jgi:large conductance mechanosensitive channel
MPELTESRHDVLPRSDCGEYTTLAEAKAAGAPTLNYGLFFNVLLDFLIVAFAVFMLIRQVNRLKRVEKLPEATRKACPFCYSNIATKATRCPQCTSALAAG